MSSLETISAEFIKKFEGYSSKAYWDVNAYRIGHGSDTIELPNGTYRKVVKTDVTTPEYAKKDLSRRLKTEFIPKVEKTIGSTYWKKLPQLAQVALISLAYNYGNVTKQAIIDSARTGDVDKLSKSIVDSTYNDNKSLPLDVQDTLRKRRQAEANLVKSSKIITSAQASGRFVARNWYWFALGGLALGGIVYGIYKGAHKR